MRDLHTIILPQNEETTNKNKQGKGSDVLVIVVVTLELEQQALYLVQPQLPCTNR